MIFSVCGLTCSFTSSSAIPYVLFKNSLLLIVYVSFKPYDLAEVLVQINDWHLILFHIVVNFVICLRER
ncbi:hypothetical protein BDF20DRAFT_845147 [Mycotypha africana]|uniref:uncharacterized protein n=1 Tax=Mycotypha africana TaxID=64632 RepID=UPI0023012C0B|nr:uncharacterized protein BDF20DRAFT_845147 [Mycotypha africana]KAI8991533.1 hypothetical protein BDF20DRAFT_845147 [Mycotypha africana]